MKSVLTTCMLIALLACLPVQGAVEDFTEWTAVDPLGVYTIDETSVTATNLDRKSQTYVYKDWGANYWNDDWQFQFEFTPGAVSHTTGAHFGVVTLANDLGSWHQIQYIDGVGVRYDRSATGYWLRLDWSNYPTLISSTPAKTLTVSTKYYCTFIRDRDGGAAEQGRFTLHVCTTDYYGETGAVLVETQTLDVPAGERVDYRYTFVAQNRSNGGYQLQSGKVEKLDVSGEPTPPSGPFIYYVDGTDGSDSATGLSTGSAWRTIGKANASVAAGDTVYIMEGTYSETINPGVTGTSGHAITYAAYSNDTVTFTTSSYGADLRGKSYITISGLRFVNCGNSWVYMYNTDGASTHNLITGCTFDGCTAWAGIWMQGACSYNRITNNTMTGYTQPDDLVYLRQGPEKNLVANNTMNYAAHAAVNVNVEATDNVVRDNTIWNPWHSGIVVWRGCDRTFVSGNVIIDCGENNTQIPVISPDGDRATTRAKARQFHWGIQLGSEDCKVRNNIMVNCGAMQLDTYASTSALANDNRIYNNVFFGNQYGIYSEASELATDNQIINNAIHESASRAVQQYLHADSHNTWTYNNIVGQIVWSPLDESAHDADWWDTNKSAYFGNNEVKLPGYAGSRNVNATDNSDLDPAWFALADTSDMIDAGGWLTTTVGADTSTTLTVVDANWFYDGLGITSEVGDLIQIEGQSTAYRITSIDYDAGEITLDSAATWTAAKGVALAFAGDAPDMGAFERTAASSYYVDAVGGNDSSGTGTISAPWKTMAKAEAESDVNDIISIIGWSSDLEDETWPVHRLYYADGISSNSVTWTFGETARIGRFCTGDFWVIGPVSVENINPASAVVSGSTRNGSMVNPVTNAVQGFDSRSAGYSDIVNVGYGVGTSTPLAVANGSSLLSAISLSEASDASYVGKIAVLTVLDTVPAPNSFRPSYFGTDKTVNWNADDLDYDVLGTLDGNDVGLGATVPDLATTAALFRRPWVSFGWSANGRQIHPVNNGIPAYGRDRSVRVGIGSLLLQLHFTNDQKADLFTYMTQVGIDWYGVVSHEGGRTTWQPNGGHCMGHKFPILFAGAALDDEDLLGVADKSGAYLWSAKPGGGTYGPGDVPPDYMYFQEDASTFYVDRDMVDLTLRTSISGYALAATSSTITVTGLPRWYGQIVGQRIEITGGTGAGQIRTISGSTYNRSQYETDPTTLTVSEAWTTTPTTSSQYRLLGYESSHLDLAEWGIRHADYPDASNPAWGADYRSVASVAFPGWTLAAWIMDLKDAWNHDPLFDYVDRWMFETSDEGDHKVDNRTNSAFVEAMWVTFRDNYPVADQPPARARSPVPADGAALIHPFTSILSWTATMDANIPTYADEFEVYFGTDAESLSSIGKTTELYIDLPDYLEYGATYYWRVDANNPQDVTEGNVWSFTTESGVPDQVTGGSPANGQANVAVSRNLTWPAASGASSYAVYLDGDLLATTTTRSVAVSLAYDTTYTWRVDAIGPGGTTTGSTMTFSTVASATVDPDPPGLPDLPGLGRRYVVPTPVASRSDRMTSRYSTQYEGLRAEEVTLTESGVFAIETTSGYLEGIVVLPEGSDTSWSLTIADAWGAQLFSDTLDMTEGVVAWYGQRLPFVEGLQITVDDLDGTAYLKLLFTETWRR